MGEALTTMMVELMPAPQDGTPPTILVGDQPFLYSVDLSDHIVDPANKPSVIVLTYVDKQKPHHHPDRITYVKFSKKVNYGIERIYRPDNLEMDKLCIRADDEFLKGFSLCVNMTRAVMDLCNPH